MSYERGAFSGKKEKEFYSRMKAEGKHARELMMDGPHTGRWVPEILADNNPDDLSYYPYMNGQLVFKNAVVRFSEVIMEGLKHNNLNNEY